jgi:hypothetical protein
LVVRDLGNLFEDLQGWRLMEHINRMPCYICAKYCMPLLCRVSSFEELWFALWHEQLGSSCHTMHRVIYSHEMLMSDQPWKRQVRDGHCRLILCFWGAFWTMGGEKFNWRKRIPGQYKTHQHVNIVDLLIVRKSMHG